MVPVKMKFYVWLWFFITLWILPLVSSSAGNICFGTENGLSKVSSRNEPELLQMKRRYQNCTIIHGNLELIAITKEKLIDINDLSMNFLSDIEEVTGYVLIAENAVEYMTLPKLRIIWGDNFFTLGFAVSSNTSSTTSPVNSINSQTSKPNNYGLLIKGNSVKHLSLPSLRVVQAGNLGVMHNKYICHWRTIDYRQLLGDDYLNRALINDNHNQCTKNVDDQCSGCDNCYSENPADCQQIYRNDCAGQCSTGMCFNKSSPMFCCNEECAGGCYGPTDRECYGCLKFRNEGKCVNACPAKEHYNHITRQIEINPNGKFAFSRDCVVECPVHMSIFKDGCVSRCPEGYFEDDKKVCQNCTGLCPKKCIIKDVITADNIKTFTNCTIVDGSIAIHNESFHGMGNYDYDANGNVRFLSKSAGIRPEDLEVMSHVTHVINGVYIQSSTNLKSLNFLRNLKVIEGRTIETRREGRAFSITGTDLDELGLVSLKNISNGQAIIVENSKLCYADKLPWSRIVVVGPYYVQKNANQTVCQIQGKICDSACDPLTGCWGPGPQMCFECNHYKLGSKCVPSCKSEEGFYESSPKNCDYCHQECLTCNGQGPRNCTQCRNVEMDRECVPKCPVETHYLQESNKTCLKCHDVCSPFGCSGPGNFVGPKGCNKCKFARVEENDLIRSCLPIISPEHLCSTILNEDNYFWTSPNKPQISPYVTNGICQKCHKLCRNCSGYGIDQDNNGCFCVSSAYRVSKPESGEFYCAEKCPKDFYNITSPIRRFATVADPQECYPCHPECEGCSGPSASECNKCKTHTVFNNDGFMFNCTDVCPEDQPFSSKSMICTKEDLEKLARDSQRNKMAVVGTIGGIVVLIMIIVCVVALYFRRKSSLLQKLNPPDDVYEMNPDAKPDLSQLKIIVFDSELKMSGKPLGFGAFGVVYKGVWINSEKKNRVPVAIKVLHEATSAAQTEMLNEASLMARMNHPHLIRLIGVCMCSKSMMLVAPLMPLGNLLDYIQNNRSKIGSAALLRWCTQIASGMSHLESHRLVHRDLAARNILVQNPHHLRITDFGLAKLLDYGEEELKVFEGKMPIKWLALECIQYKRFTHKSDVWAYGVTVWELLTFGEKPYKDVALKDIPRLLEDGERLPQPKICTLDVYMILIKCWMVDADSRPSFIDLRDNFAKLSKDPGRYLVIEGDKFLRLPSYTTEEQCELVRQLVDDPDVCNPDEYLDNPQTPSLPSTPTKPLLDRFPLDQPSDVRSRNNNRSQSTSIRYQSDPLKNKAKTVPSLDTSNYLIPDSIQSQQSPISTSSNNNGMYTPIITSSNGVAAPKNIYYNELPSPGEDSAIFSGNEESAADNMEYMIPKRSRAKMPRGQNPSIVEVIQTETVV